MDVLVSALNEESIAVRIVPIQDVEPTKRPDWACTPGDEVYVVVPVDKREEALELTGWVYRVCVECETFLLPKLRACQECGTPHPMEPGPRLGRAGQVLTNAVTGQVKLIQNHLSSNPTYRDLGPFGTC